MILNKDRVITSPIEPTKNRRKYWQRKGTNIIPTDISYWESGFYSNIDGTKQPYDAGGRVRLKNLIEVTPNTEYIVSTNFTSALIIIRSYDQNQEFIQSKGSISDGNILTTSENEKYISITINDDSTTNTQAILMKIENGTIKPFISVEPAIFELNENGQYEEIRKVVNVITGVEFETGRIIDGKIEYGKRIDCGALPNNTTKNVNHNINENFTITGFENHFKNSSEVQIVFNEIGINISAGYTSYIYCYVTRYIITYITQHNASNYSGYVILYYTKN